MTIWVFPSFLREEAEKYQQGIKLIKSSLFRYFIVLSTISLALFLACDKKPTEPEYDNPFDIAPPKTGGDPFQLTVKIAGGE